MKGKSIYSQDLGINLAAKTEPELFKWFLACLLFGKPIQQQIAKQAYEKLTAAGITSLDALKAASWDNLVAILDQAHYVRFDFSTAIKLLEVGQVMRDHYGSVTALVGQSKDAGDLKQRLLAFKGIGPKTAEIFLRDVAPIWFPKYNKPFQ